MGIQIFGKNIFQIYTHHIMSLLYADLAGNAERTELSLEAIDLQRIPEELASVGTTVTTANLERLVKKNGSLCEGFVLKEKGRPIGTIWVMHKGGDDLEYRIRNIEAYIFDVYVNGKFRGKGYAGQMIRLLMEHLHQDGIDQAYLAVSVKNISAIRAYEKAGFVKTGNKRFARFLKVNIPYHIL